jgi:hydrogenase/urease accessory protein HupE
MARLALTPEDVLVVVAIALLAGLGGPAIARRSVLFLPPAWLAGGFLGAAFPAGGELAWARTISFSLAGVLVALDARLPRAWLAGLACAAGVLHGYAAGATSAHLRGWQLALLGASATVLIVAAAASAVVVRLRPPWARIAVRVAGSWIAAAGILMLGWLAR